MWRNGRRSRLRIWWAQPVEVQILSPAPRKSQGLPVSGSLFILLFRQLYLQSCFSFYPWFPKRHALLVLWYRTTNLWLSLHYPVGKVNNKGFHLFEPLPGMKSDSLGRQCLGDGSRRSCTNRGNRLLLRAVNACAHAALPPVVLATVVLKERLKSSLFFLRARGPAGQCLRGRSLPGTCGQSLRTLSGPAGAAGWPCGAMQFVS